MEDAVRTEFTLKADKIPSEIIEVFAYIEAKFLGLHGYIKTTGHSVYSGVVEGPKKIIIQLFNLISTAEKFKALIKQATFTEPVPIRLYSQEGFTILTKSDGKLWRSEFKIEGKNLSNIYFQAFTRNKAKDLKVRGHMQSIARNKFTGIMEGRKEALEKLKRAIIVSDEFKNKIGYYEFNGPTEISHYSEDAFDVKSEEKNLFCCDFEIHGKDIPNELFELFTEKSVQEAGARGCIQCQSDGIFHGRLEGERLAIESIQEALVNADEFYTNYDKCIFSELKPLEKYTNDHFTRISFELSGSLKKLYTCDFVIKGTNISKDLFYILADAHTEMWGVRGNMKLTDGGLFKGTIEGEITLIESLKEVLKLLIKITPITEFKIGSIREIPNFTTSSFKISM